MAERRGEVVNKSRLCLITGRSRQQIDRWVIDGCPVAEAAKDKGGEWKFNTAAVFDWLERRGEDPTETLDINKERARLAKEQADAQALRNAALRLEYLPAGEVVAGWQSAIGRARSLLLGVPISASPEVVVLVRGCPDDAAAETEIRNLLTKQIDDALTELSNTALEDDDEPGDEGGLDEGGEAVGPAP